MNLKNDFYLKGKYLLLFVCFFYSSSKINAKDSNAIRDIITHRENAAAIDNTNFLQKFVLDSDSIPGRKEKLKSQGWEVLFDGKNTDKWRGKNSENFPSKGWVVKDGTLFLNETGAGDIITREMYSNFELVLDFKLTYNANSGVKYFVNEIKNKKTGEVVINGPEYQIIDDYNYPEVKDHKHDIASTASCYLLYTPENKKLHPYGQWNHVKIIAIGKHVEHWLNGVKVLSYERGSEDFLKRKAVTKFADFENYGEEPEGHILLTDHHDKVYFRNIKIRRL
ncbi:MAG: DUF1080 domain-containing protein [Bacteroidota bacterium]|nr:DUF1080 domain-containing protein [Bacteroidota bacterium]